MREPWGKNTLSRRICPTFAVYTIQICAGGVREGAFWNSSQHLKPAGMCRIVNYGVEVQHYH